MLLALLLSIFVLCLYRIRFNLKGFNDDYLSKDCTNSIKGIFILLIVISHGCLTSPEAAMPIAQQAIRYS